MERVNVYADALFELVNAANRFLFAALPLRRVESRQALEAFISFATRSQLAAPTVESVLIRTLAVLDPQGQHRPRGLVERYLAASPFPGNTMRFQECVEELLRDRGVDDVDVESGVRFLERNFRNPKLTANDVADYVHVPLSDLRRRFASITGVSIEEYKRGLRLDEAALQLATTGKSVKEIWAYVGYNFHENFCHDFRGRFAVSPTDYRERVGVCGPSTCVTAADAVRDYRRRAPRILLVDDDEVYLMTTARLFSSSGYRVEYAVSATEGLNLAIRTAFDAIILDHRLGQMTGLEVLRAMRVASARSPVVLFSADWTLETHAHEIRSLGATMMSKLSDFESLTRLVSSLCAMPLESDAPRCSEACS